LALFFQAEDGIRDRNVTGVQTCALPIWKIGEVRQVRAQYLQDWLADADAPLSWRLDKTVAGSGALGDIGAHITDLVQFLTGQQITGVTAMTETFVTERPIETERAGTAGVGGDELGAVAVDDTALRLA